MALEALPDASVYIRVQNRQAYDHVLEAFADQPVVPVMPQPTLSRLFALMAQMDLVITPIRQSDISQRP